MPKIFNLTNHTATDQQITDAQKSLGITECIDLPASLKKLWGEIPPEADSVTSFVEPVLSWLAETASPEDVVWAQGEWGATVCILQWCRTHGLRCVYSTTARTAIEQRSPDGTIAITHQFKHVRFRDYP